MSICFRNGPVREIASSSELKFARVWVMSCKVRIPANYQLVPEPGKPHDWPRSTAGREFLADTFLTRLNFFFENLQYLSARTKPTQGPLRGLRPVGVGDMANYAYSLDGKRAAAGSNGVLGTLLAPQEKEPLWPDGVDLKGEFKQRPIESTLLVRATNLVSLGFYQEAILVSFSVLDAKVQELVTSRLQVECGTTEKQTKQFLRGIMSARLDTFLNFLMRALDKASLASNDPSLNTKLMKLNTKRNAIVHRAEPASRSEAIEAIATVVEVLAFAEKHHGASYDLPQCLRDEMKRWFWMG